MSCHTYSCEPSDTSTRWRGYNYTFIHFLCALSVAFRTTFLLPLRRSLEMSSLTCFPNSLNILGVSAALMTGADCMEPAISSRENIVRIALFISVKIVFVGKIIDKRLGRVSIQEQTVSIEEHPCDFQSILFLNCNKMFQD